MAHHDPDPHGATPLAELAGLFVRLGVISFGGPAAHAGPATWGIATIAVSALLVRATINPGWIVLGRSLQRGLLS